VSTYYLKIKGESKRKPKKRKNASINFFFTIFQKERTIFVHGGTLVEYIHTRVARSKNIQMAKFGHK